VDAHEAAAAAEAGGQGCGFADVDGAFFDASVAAGGVDKKWGALLAARAVASSVAKGSGSMRVSTSQKTS
jgi:hypothetical protein